MTSPFLPNLAIAGYRSFGRIPQYFERFSKINIFIGQNNAGKSNILRFLHEIYPRVGSNDLRISDQLAFHLPDRPPMLLGIGEELEKSNQQSPRLPANHRLIAREKDATNKELLQSILGRLFFLKAQIDNSDLCWTMLEIPDLIDQQVSWEKAIEKLEYHQIRRAWEILTKQGDGDRKQHWEPETLRSIKALPIHIKSYLVPAIRQIGAKGSVSDDFDGEGIIERVAMLQNPDVHSQSSRKKFIAIRDFLRSVIDRPNATIEVPYERDTILVHMDGKVLPVESLGSGVHEVLILASAATVLENSLVCIEEPELHLNPVLQKKLVRYLSQNTSNQYFITTHSAALMDTPGAEVYHIRMADGASIVERATSDEHRSHVCADLGYHPSDLLQANCVIWVEGPSDRIYLNWWISHFNSTLIEGIHYSIMFYGGRLASHLSQATESPEIDDFIMLRRLNRRGVIIMDSDRDAKRKQINATKRRLKNEFEEGPGHAWITEGREIENYIDPSQITAAISAVHPHSNQIKPSGQYESLLKIRSSKGSVTTAFKVDVAKNIAMNYKPDTSILDLKKRLARLLDFIFESNPLE